MTEGINSFKLRQIQAEPLTSNRPLAQKTKDASFENLLKDKINETKDLQFSKHSMDRIEERGIEVSETLIEQINAAARKARSKGAKEVVMIGRESAFIVNIPNNIIITAMSEQEMKENIFTNIDSAVIL